MEKATNRAITSTSMASSTRFAWSATLMPTMFSPLVITMNPAIHTGSGMAGNWAFRYEAPISQITIGMKT